MISIIVAVAENMGIGKGNNLLWQLPSDLKHFKAITMGKSVVMGKNTWFSLPKRPLPGRRNIVLTDLAGETFEGAESVYSIAEAVSKCEGDDEYIIMGGGSVYRQFMPLADKLYITEVAQTAEADVFFPTIDPKEWQEISRESHLDEEIPYSYVEYERIRN